jgi:hypothetical protein
MSAAPRARAPSGTTCSRINWSSVQCRARGLQARIVKATPGGRHHKAKAPHWLLTHSFSGKGLAAKRVTENKGKGIPGVDKVTWKTPRATINAITSLRRRGYSPRPLRRAFTLKKNGKMRPRGIPVMKCRANIFALSFAHFRQTTGGLRILNDRRDLRLLRIYPHRLKFRRFSGIAIDGTPAGSPMPQ